ncbi:MAG: HAD family phosphatase [Eubacterium sp.]|nr:HAD family phosphatase [Eubacterium sp.]
MSIKNVIFDVGDVLVSFRYMDYMRELGFDIETAEFIRDNIILTDFWKGLDAGREDIDDAAAKFSSLYPEFEHEIRSFWENIADIVSEYDYSAPLIKKLKDRGYRVYLLSNYPDKLADMHWSQFSFLDMTDGYIISAKVKLAKPDPAIFHLLMDKYDLDIKECLFIDDNKDNIEAANRLGLANILFTGYDNMISDLREMKIM